MAQIRMLSVRRLFISLFVPSALEQWLITSFSNVGFVAIYPAGEKILYDRYTGKIASHTWQINGLFVTSIVQLFD